jgi:hypothetical protein
LPSFSSSSSSWSFCRRHDDFTLRERADLSRSSSSSSSSSSSE